MKLDPKRVYESIAKNLREFGYSDATSQMIRDTHEVMNRRQLVMPHGIIGVFARRQLSDLIDEGGEF